MLKKETHKTAPKYPERRSPAVTLICKECGWTCRRELMNEAGSRGVHETSSEPGLCPKGHGLMVRKDGVKQENWALWAIGKFFKRSFIKDIDK